MTTVLRVGVMLVVWLALWAEVSVANVVSGLAVAVAVALVDPRRRGAVVLRPVAVARFVAYFVIQLVVATFVVARTVMAPKERIHTGIVSVPLKGGSETLAAVVAHAISLTPGTLTVEVRRDPLTLFVHALDVREVDQLRTDIRRLEVLAVRAFGTSEAIAGLQVDDVTVWRQR